jgi:predicted transposase YbfD/YdcC
VDKGHGRIEMRMLTATDMLAGYVNLPYAKAVFRLERHRTDLKGEKPSCEITYGVSSLSAKTHDPAAILKYVRQHWSIENKVHWVRDVTFDEDRSQVRKHNGPQIMASLRNVAMSLLRMAGIHTIVAGTRYLSRHLNETLRLIGIC